jgi:5-methylcytosine-specific restriction endonuclease McrA
MDYKSKRWRKLRERILKRDGYMCQESKRYGKMVEANTVHHIFPVSRFPEYIWCEWNLISLSSAAHNRMHIRDTDELTEEGERLMKRTARKQGIELYD